MDKGLRISKEINENRLERDITANEMEKV